MKGGGGLHNACICMGTHSQPLLQNRLLDVTKLGRDEVPMVRHMHKDVLAIFVQGADPGRGKIGHRGGTFLKNFFRPEGYSNKPNS